MERVQREAFDLRKVWVVDSGGLVVAAAIEYEEVDLGVKWKDLLGQTRIPFRCHADAKIYLNSWAQHWRRSRLHCELCGSPPFFLVMASSKPTSKAFSFLMT